jgi:SH3-like domain-containing protein
MIRLWYAALAAVLLSLLATPGINAAPKRLGVVTAGVLNVRAKPARHFERIGKFHRGDTVKVVQETDDWLEVIVPDDAKAWVAGKHLDGNGVVTATKLQIRSGPGIVFTAYATVDKGAKLELVGPPLDEWQQILAPPTATGWVSRAYVRLQAPIPVASKPAEKPAATVAAKAPEKPEKEPESKKPTVVAKAPEKPVEAKKPEPPKPAPIEPKKPEPEKPVVAKAPAEKPAVSVEPGTVKTDEDATEYIRRVVHKETGVEVIIEAREPKIITAEKPVAAKKPEPVVVKKPEAKPAPEKPVIVKKPEVKKPEPVVAKKPEPKPAPKKTVVIEKPKPEPVVVKKPEVKKPATVAAKKPEVKKPEPKPAPKKAVVIEQPKPKPVVAKKPEPPKPEPKPAPKKTVVIEQPKPEPVVVEKPEVKKPEPKPVVVEKPEVKKPEPMPVVVKTPESPRPEKPAPPAAAPDKGEDVAYLAPIRAPEAPSVPRPTVRRPRYEAPLFVAKATTPPTGVEVEPTAPKEKPEPSPAEEIPQPDVPDRRVVTIVPSGEGGGEAAPDQTIVPETPKPERVWEEGVLFSLKDQAVPEASHILYRREGTVCYPICYLRSSRIPLSQWELREVRLYGTKIDVPGWSRPVIEVKGIQIKTLE